MFQKEGEEDAEEGWSKDAALLHASFDVKGSEMLPSYWMVAFIP